MPRISPLTIICTRCFTMAAVLVNGNMIIQVLLYLNNECSKLQNPHYKDVTLKAYTSA